MDWFYDLLTEKCAPFVLGQAQISHHVLCGAAASEALWLVAVASFIGFVFAGGSALFGWKKWQNKNKEKK